MNTFARGNVLTPVYLICYCEQQYEINRSQRILYGSGGKCVLLLGHAFYTYYQYESGAAHDVFLERRKK